MRLGRSGVAGAASLASSDKRGRGRAARVPELRKRRRFMKMRETMGRGGLQADGSRKAQEITNR